MFWSLLLSIFTIVVSFRLRTEYRSFLKNVVGLNCHRMPLVPYYPEKSKRDYIWMDIFNAWGRERKLFLGRYIDSETSNQIISSLLWLQSKDDLTPITLYCNIPGGMSRPALAIHDIMKQLTAPIETVNIGLTSGAGVLICAAGTMGNRFATPNSRFCMSVEGVSENGVIQGSAEDVRREVLEVMRENEVMEETLSGICHKPIQILHEDLQRNFYLTAVEASFYGLIDRVLTPYRTRKYRQRRLHDSDIDDDTIGYGHFAEAVPVPQGTLDDSPHPPDVRTSKFDRLGSEHGENSEKSNGLQKNKYQGRFATARCKPPSRPPTEDA